MHAMPHIIMLLVVWLHLEFVPEGPGLHPGLTSVVGLCRNSRLTVIAQKPLQLVA